jgi:beta-N-acetylhexosaminidase
MSSSLRKLISSLVMVGFQGTKLNDDTKKLIDNGIGGAILFKRNIENAHQTAQLNFDLKQYAGRPFLCAVDQEGGRVARLRGTPFTELPPMRNVNSVELASKIGALLAFECRSVGFDFDFAPVMDVDTNPKNPVIGDRSFSEDPFEVSKLAVALAQAMEANGVASCAKHFPGHGDTAQDSHHDLPRLPHDLRRLKEIELVPFQQYSKANLASVMTAHVVFEALDAKVPATMSALAMTKLLREELGFSGVIVSDDLEMKAIAQHFSVERAFVEGLNAGVDYFLICHQVDVQNRAIDAAVKAVESGQLKEEKLHQAKVRVDSLMRKFARGPEMLVHQLGSPEHQRVQAGIVGDGVKRRDPTEV